MFRLFNGFGRGVASKVAPSNSSIASVQHEDFETTQSASSSQRYKIKQEFDVFFQLNQCRQNKIVLNNYKLSRFNLNTSFGNQSYPISIDYDQESNHENHNQRKSGFDDNEESSYHINLPKFCMSSFTLGSLWHLSRTAFSYHKDVLKHVHGPRNHTDHCAYSKAKQLVKATSLPHGFMINGIRAAPVSANDYTPVVQKSKVKKVRIKDEISESQRETSSPYTKPHLSTLASSSSSRCESNGQSNVEANLEEFTNISKDCSGASFNIMGIKNLNKGDYKTALSYFEEGSSTGHSKSQFNLALCYDRGIGIKPNIDKALKLYADAAWQGHTGSQYNLALHLINSKSVAKRVEALHLLEAAAEGGLLQAQAFLGAYLTKDGMHQDLKKAVKILKLAAAQGDAASMYQLGVCHENGLGGLAKNTVKAYDLYKTSASNEHVPAHYNMAALLERGEAGVTMNMNVVKELYEYAANKGHAASKERLSLIRKVEGMSDTSNIASLVNNKVNIEVNTDDKLGQKLPLSPPQDQNEHSVLFFIGPDVTKQACTTNEQTYSIFETVDVMQNIQKVPLYKTKTHKSFAALNDDYHPVSKNLSHLHHNCSSPASLSLSAK